MNNTNSQLSHSPYGIQSGRAQPHSMTLSRVTRPSLRPPGLGVRLCSAALFFGFVGLLIEVGASAAQNEEIGITNRISTGPKPIPVSISGFSGEALDALKF